MMYIKPSGEFSVCNHHITEHERIKHKAIPVFLKSLKYRKGPKESLFQFLSPEILRIWFVHSLDMNYVHLPAVVCISEMSLRMLNYFYKYFNKIVCPINWNLTILAELTWCISVSVYKKNCMIKPIHF